MLIRRKSSTDDEYHHADPVGVFGVITGANGGVLSSNLYGALMSMQYAMGTTETSWIARGTRMQVDEDLIFKGSSPRAPGRSVVLNLKPKKRLVPDKSFCEDQYKLCLQCSHEIYESCLTGWGAGGMICGAGVGYIGGCIIGAGGEVTCELPKGVGARAGVIACIGIGVGAGDEIGKTIRGLPCLSAQKDREKSCLSKKDACKKSGRWGHGRPHYSD